MSHDKHLRCSFCGKSKDSVRKFISGPSVYICNECIAPCNEILAEDEEREVPEAINQVPIPSQNKEVADPELYRGWGGVVAWAIVKGPSRRRASAWASSVLPTPVGPMRRMFDLSSSTSTSRPWCELIRL